MANILKLENGGYIAELSQRELNAIALLLGYSSDELIKDRADDWEIQYKDISLGNELANLYNKFYGNMSEAIL